MKNVFKLLALTATISFPSALMAQQSGNVVTPLKPNEKTFNPAAKPEFELLQETSKDSIRHLPFMNHMPGIVPHENRNLNIETFQANPDYDNNMPVVKPGRTSNIPVRKLDAKSPYIYNMPVRKTHTNKK